MCYSIIFQLVTVKLFQFFNLSLYIFSAMVYSEMSIEVQFYGSEISLEYEQFLDADLDLIGIIKVP